MTLRPSAILPSFALLGLASVGLGCGDGGTAPPPFVLHVIAGDGNDPSFPDPVILNAVDEIEILLVPDRSRGQSFDDVAPEVYEEGQVETRLAPAGEFVIRLRRRWIVEHAVPNGATFQVDVPLYSIDEMPDPEVREPTLSAFFIRTSTGMTERVAEGTLAGTLPWPLPPSGQASVLVHCDPDFALACCNDNPDECG